MSLYRRSKSRYLVVQLGLYCSSFRRGRGRWILIYIFDTAGIYYVLVTVILHALSACVLVKVGYFSVGHIVMGGIDGMTVIRGLDKDPFSVQCIR